MIVPFEQTSFAHRPSLQSRGTIDLYDGDRLGQRRHDLFYEGFEITGNHDDGSGLIEETHLRWLQSIGVRRCSAVDQQFGFRNIAQHRGRQGMERFDRRQYDACPSLAPTC